MSKNFWEIDDLRPAFAYSHEVIKVYAKSFYIACQLLPTDKKWATYSVYAFCRFADNLIDKIRDRSLEDLNLELSLFEEELKLGYKFGESEHPALSGLIYSMKKYNMPLEYALDLIKGVRMDLNIKRYDSFDELYVFCYRVASVVGLMMTYILGFKEKETLIYAEKLGIAMQLTNILRDVQEDKQMNRIYLPKDLMDKYGITYQDIIDEKFSDNFKALMKEMVNRAWDYYHESEKGIEMLDANARFAIVAASKIYSGILTQIEKNDYNPFKGRVFVPKSKKIAIIFSEYIKFRF